MWNTSQKHRSFIGEPMKDKPVTELPGIGKVLGERLTSAGYGKASAVLGQFLILDKNPMVFQTWVQNICQANSKQAADCCQCLQAWCEEFL